MAEKTCPITGNICQVGCESACIIDRSTDQIVNIIGGKIVEQSIDVTDKFANTSTEFRLKTTDLITQEVIKRLQSKLK